MVCLYGPIGVPNLYSSIWVVELHLVVLESEDVHLIGERNLIYVLLFEEVQDRSVRQFLYYTRSTCFMSLFLKWIIEYPDEKSSFFTPFSNMNYLLPSL